MTETTNTILDALLAAEGGLTLAGLAEATGLPCAELRAALDGLDTSVCSALIERETGKPKVRVFTPTPQGRCARESVLNLLAEQGTEETLRAATRETLRAACAAFEVPVKAKDTKDALVAAILSHRATLGALCARCGEEPVAHAGEVCTCCEEAATPAHAAPTEASPRVRKAKAERAPGDLRIRIRRPDVALNLTDGERAEVESIVKGAASQRAAQRDVGYWLAAKNPEHHCDAEVLRTILRTHGVLNVANFTINAKKEGWTKVESGGALAGWTIPAHTVKVTAKAAERGA